MPNSQDPKDWLILDSVDSTQNIAAEMVRGANSSEAVIFAHEQTAGKGRFGRTWFSPKGSSISISIILAESKGHPRPWLLGMSLACAAAEVLHCRVRWPNDLYLDGKKLGGILTELIEEVPVIGLGVNLNQTSFSEELSETAISLAMHRPGHYEPLEFGSRVISAFLDEPAPQDWPQLAPIWDIFDDTPGKNYKLPNGELAAALGIGPHGELLCSVEGEMRTVMAAEAWMS